MVELTREQLSALQEAEGEPVAVIDPGSQQTYYIVSEHDRNLLRELAEEERVVAAFTEASLRNVISRLRDEP